MKDKNIIVIGHKNPDTDSICAAIAYANLKNKLNGGGYEACRAGELSEETQYVLKKFGMEAPRLCTNVGVQISDINVDEVAAVESNASLKAVWDAMGEKEISGQPVVNENGELVGIVTLNDIAKKNMDSVNADILAEAKTPATNIVEILNGELIAGKADFVIEKGNIVVGAAGTEYLDSAIKENDIVITADRQEIQSKAIDLGASVLVICLDSNVSDLVLSKANETGCAVIRTQYDTYTATKLVAQSLPIGAVMTAAEKIVSFTPESKLTDVQETMAGLRHIYFPVVDENNKYLGLINKASLANGKTKKLVLVDHNEMTQCVDGFDEAEILEVVDHHRLADIQTKDPILVRNQPVGCTCTILFQMYQEAGVAIEKDIAGLMLSAIMSDTLDLRSPTCTKVDVWVTEQLEKIAGVDHDELAEEIFAAGENLDGKTPEDIFYQDFKIFAKGDARFGIGQASFMSAANLTKAKEMLLDYIPSTLSKDGTDMAFFMLTSVKDQGSLMIYAGDGSEELLKKAFGKDVDESGKSIMLEGIVSRKKQLAPAVLENL